MKRVGFQFKVRQDRLAEYKEHHKNVWPEMLDALRETGWHNYTLFMREDGLIFGYFETEEDLSRRPGKNGGKGSQHPLAGIHVSRLWMPMPAPMKPLSNWKNISIWIKS